jgi:hypothetical protein
VASNVGDSSRIKPGQHVVQTATLALTVESPTDALRAAKAIAERHGGHLKSASNSGTDHEQAGGERVVASLRVRADSFYPALAALKRLGSGPASESIERQDVSDEYVDLEARLRAQKRVEEQYLALLARANVTETIEIYKHLGVVRIEIERLEGRRRQLEQQVKLSSIDVTFEPRRPLVSISGRRFMRALQSAAADVLNVGAGIVLAAIRVAGVLLPVSVLLLLPVFFGLRWWVRRLSRVRTASAR